MLTLIGLSLFFSPGASTSDLSGRQTHAAAKSTTSYQCAGGPYLFIVHDLELTGGELVFQCDLKKVIAPSEQCPGLDWNIQKLYVGFFDGNCRPELGDCQPEIFSFRKRFWIDDEFLHGDAQLVTHQYRIRVPHGVNSVGIGLETADTLLAVSVDLPRLANERNPKRSTR